MVSAKPKGRANPKKDKVFHPQSRKAGQLVRTSLRKEKIHTLASKRGQRQHSLVDVYRFFHQCLPGGGVLTLEELHHFIRDVWLPRFDGQLEAEQAARRIGRPKSATQMKLEEIKLREAEEYRTGLEVIDLMHVSNVELFRQWDQKEVAYVEQLRFVRVSSANTSMVRLSRRGKHPSLVGDDVGMGELDAETHINN